MFCKYCGKQIPDNVKYCVYCGREVDGSSEQEISSYPGPVENQGVNTGEGTFQNNYIAGFGQERMAGNRKKNLLTIGIVIALALALVVGISIFFIFVNRTGRKPGKETYDKESLTLSVSESSIASVETVTPTLIERLATVSEDIPSELSEKTELYFCTAVASSALVQANTSIYNGAECAVDGDVITSSYDKPKP